MNKSYISCALQVSSINQRQPRGSGVHITARKGAIDAGIPGECGCLGAACKGHNPDLSYPIRVLLNEEERVVLASLLLV